MFSQCNEEGNWSPSTPSNGCERVSCPSAPNIIDNGKIIDDSISLFKYRDIATYSCNPGYVEDDNLYSMVCQVSFVVTI